MNQRITNQLELIIHNDRMRRRNRRIVRCLWIFVILMLTVITALIYSIETTNKVAYWALVVPFILIKAYGAQLLISDVGVITDYDIALMKQNKS